MFPQTVAIVQSVSRAKQKVWLSLKSSSRQQRHRDFPIGNSKESIIPEFPEEFP